MNLKKYMTIIISCLMVFATFVGASAADDNIATTNEGDPLLDLVQDNLGVLDQMKTNRASLTIIAGALCSTFPDTGKDYTPSSSSVNRLCRTNNEHIGEAFQLFRLNDNGDYVYLGERQISKGEKACFDVSFGAKYHYDIYYCDETARTCTNFVSECRTYDQTQRTRICSDTGKESVWVDYVDIAAPLCAGVPLPQADNPSSDPEPPQGTNGFIGVPTISSNNINIDDSVTITQTFQVSDAGTYLLEAGIERIGALGFINVGSNDCNPNDKHFSNKVLQLDAGIHTVEFTVQPVEGVGTYKYHTAWVDDCGGNIIQQVNAPDEVKVNPGGASGTSTSPQANQRAITILSIVFMILGVAAAYFFPAIGIPLAILGLTLFVSSML